jgi:alpha-amylase
VAENLQPVSAISVPSPISWADEERDLTAWLGNELQTAAFEKMYELSDRVNTCQYDQIRKDWIYLQSSDHLYYMSTKFFSDGAVHAYFNPYETPYDAFMNYMNILSDFEIRLNRMCPATDEQIELLKLDSLLKVKNEMIAKQSAELDALKRKIEKLKPKKAAGTKKGVGSSRASKAGSGVKSKTLSELAAEAQGRVSVKPGVKKVSLAKEKKAVKSKAPAKGKTSSTAVKKKVTSKSGKSAG